MPKYKPGRGYKGDNESCPHGCGLTYGKLRTGMTYTHVFQMLKDNHTDPKDWTYKRRSKVLGAWFAIKRSMWDYHCNVGGCSEDPRNMAAIALEHSVVVMGDAIESFDDEEAPF